LLTGSRLLGCAVGLILAGGCGSSDSGETELVFNPGALTYARLTTNTASDTYPVWNSAGDQVVFISTRTGDPEVWILGLTDTSLRRITSGERYMVSRASWSPDGESVVFAADFDESGPPAEASVRLWIVAYLSTLPNLRQLTEGAVVDSWPAWSPDGATVLFSRADTLRLIPSDGGDVESLALDGLGGVALEAVWSPDGQRVAYSIFDGTDYNVYVQNVNDGTPIAVATTAANERNPAWSPGGRYIAFQSDAAGNWDIWVVGSAGGSPENLTGSCVHQDTQPSWSPLGGRIVYCSDQTGNEDLWTVDGVPFTD